MSNQETKASESKLQHFFKGVQAEFRKILWPDRETLVKQLIAVLSVTIIVGALIALIDFGAQNLIDLLISIGK